MIRIYYDPNTGEITRTVSESIAANDINLPYILHNKQIRLDKWRVNTDTKQLEEI